MKQVITTTPRPRRILGDTVREMMGGISRQVLRDLIDRKKLPACRISRNIWWFFESDVEEFLKKNEVRSAQTA